VHPVTAAAESTPESTGVPASEATVEPATDAAPDAGEEATADSGASGDDATAEAVEAATTEGAAATEPETTEATEATEPEASEATEPAATEPTEPTEPEASEATEPAATETTEPTESTEALEPEATESETIAPASGTSPAPSPAAVPAPAPRPGPRAPSAPAASDTEPWGRVDEDGTVSVREGDGWRVVGQYPDGTADEALAYYQRKFSDLAGEVTLLEVRHRRGGASAADLRATARALHAKLQDAAAVGNLAALDARVLALTGELTAASETEAAASRQAVEDAVRARTELVEKAEALAARDPRTVQWKQASAELTSLFDQWQSQQQNGPRLPKSTGQQLWKRFRDARATVDKHRREFYAELDEAHKAVRDQKARLVERAEALAPKGEDGIQAYRELLDQWKTAGRAGKKADDALWARFKAAGDALYGARGEREAADAEASREKIEAKRALLEEARGIADVRDLGKARSALTAIQRKWDEIGRIFPRDKERVLDDDLRKIESALRTREETDWKRNNPETKARANDMTRQLTEAIEKLEDELAQAEASRDKAAIAKATEALEARRAWLSALGGGS
jgi:hypothetical protein